MDRNNFSESMTFEICGKSNMALFMGKNITGRSEELIEELNDILVVIKNGIIIQKGT